MRDLYRPTVTPTLTRDIRLYENLQGSAVTHTPVAERLAVKLSLSVLMT